MSHSFQEEPELTYEQAKQALYRALELQAERETSMGVSENVSREQLAQMAAELGVKPEYVREAANELLTATTKPQAWHIDPKIGFDHWIDRPLAEEDWVQIGKRIQPFTQTLGSWDEEKKLARWNGPYQLKLTLTGIGQRSRAKLVIDESLEWCLGCGFVFSAVLLLAGTLGAYLSDHDTTAMALIAGQFVAYTSFAFWIKIRANRNRRRRIQHVARELSEYFD